MGLAAACADRCLHGVCINGTCICDPGWTGNADLLTGDLTAWGGPVLNCTTNLQILILLWWIILGLCIVALLVAAVATYQQWQKLQTLRTQGFRKPWFQYQPLLLTVGHVTSPVVPLLLGAIGKIFTPDDQRVIGIDAFSSIIFLLVFVIGIPFTCVYAFHVLAAFSGGIRSEMAPNQWRQKLLDVARLFYALAGFMWASTGLYMIVYLSVSPLPGRHIHELCDRLMSLQLAVASLLFVIADIAFTVEMLRNINCTLRERAVLVAYTRTAEMRASLKVLRSTRFKLVVLQLTSVNVCFFIAGINFWLAIDSSGLQYGSYKVAVMSVGYVLAVLSMLQTYTSFSVPSSKRISELCFFFRLVLNSTFVSSEPTAESGVAIQQTDDAVAGTAGFIARQHTTQEVQADFSVPVEIEGVGGRIETLSCPISSNQERPEQLRGSSPQRQREASRQQPQPQQPRAHLQSPPRTEEQPNWDC